MKKPKTTVQWSKLFEDSKSQNISRKQLAKDLEIPLSTLDYYKRKTLKAPTLKLVKLAPIQTRSTGEISVEFPSGIRIKLPDANSLEILKFIAGLK